MCDKSPNYVRVKCIAKEVKFMTSFVIAFHGVLLCDGKVLLPVLIIKGGAWIAVGVALVVFQLDFFIIKGHDGIWDKRDFAAAMCGNGLFRKRGLPDRYSRV